MKKIIVYVSGCWDLFHIGHLNFFRNARKLGDALIVGVNTDEMILGYKGYYPVIPYEQRKKIVEAIQYVDKAIPHYANQTDQFDKYNIGIVARGPNYGNFPHHKVERKYLEKTGRKIIILPYTKEISTTEIIEKIKKRQGL